MGPERSLRGAALQVDSIQVGLSRQIIERYVNEWTVELRDCTPLAHKLRDLITREQADSAQKLLPRERVYPVEMEVARRLGMEIGCMADGDTTANAQDSAECWSCPSLTGERRISPGPFIHEGRYWMVDHAYPTRLPGWLVLVLKRHAEALHELSAEEMLEMGDLIRRSCQVLREVTGCQKEYISLYAEAPHFAHLHIHIVPRAADLPEDLRGPRVFGLLTADGAVLPDEIQRLSEELRARFPA